MAPPDLMRLGAGTHLLLEKKKLIVVVIIIIMMIEESIEGHRSTSTLFQPGGMDGDIETPFRSPPPRPVHTPLASPPGEGAEGAGGDPGGVRRLPARLLRDAPDGGSLRAAFFLRSGFH